MLLQHGPDFLGHELFKPSIHDGLSFNKPDRVLSFDATEIGFVNEISKQPLQAFRETAHLGQGDREVIYRVLKPDALCVSFYGWQAIDAFMAAWKGAGFKPVDHIVWRKSYPSR